MKKNIKLDFLLLFISLIVTSFSMKNIETSIDIVPDEKTAIKVAEAIWLPIYGNDIYKKKPFIATLKDDIWKVRGTLNTQKGGVPYIEIRKSDCKVLKVTHGK